MTAINRALLALIALIFTVVTPSSAQVISLYDVVVRPPGVHYRVLTNGRHEVIYQEGRRLQAEEILWTIDQTLLGTNQIFGSRSNFGLSVVLNDFSDSGNGYVTPFPFKSEIESVSLGGRSLSKKHPSWTQLVTSHELVHAAQAEFKNNTSLVGVIHWFAPDFSRAINMFVPSGFTEGIAVTRESEITPGAGRANHPYFTMQIRAAINKRDGLSLSQLLDEPSYTRPFDRYYQGGTLFAQFMIDQYGRESIQNIMKWQQQVPILGFGANLWYATGESPRQIRRRFKAWYDLKETALVGHLGAITVPKISISRKGLVHRKPQWLDEETLVSFDLGYNQKRGFEQIALGGGRARISTNEITDDAVFYLDAEMGEILYSRNDEYPTSVITQTAFSYALNTSTGKESRLPFSIHTYNPVRLRSGKIWALKNDGQYNTIVELQGDQPPLEVLAFPRSAFVALIPRPHSDSLAVILNVVGKQAVYLLDTSQSPVQIKPWIGFEKGIVYDGAFSANGDYFSFTSDNSGLLNVYVLTTETEQLWQATNVLYGAMEPQVSPSGKQLAYIEYQDDRFDLNVTDVRPESWKTVSRDEANFTWTTDWKTQLEQKPVFFTDEANSDHALADKKYRSWTRLAPRMVYPTAYLDAGRDVATDARLGFGIGLALQGSDPLERWGYHSEVIAQKGQLWGEIGLKTGAFPFQPDLTLSRRPQTIQAVIIDGYTSTAARVIRDRTSIETGILFPYTFSSNVHRTSLITSLRMSYRSDVYVNDDFQTIQKRFNQTTFLPSAFFGYKMVKNPRDIIPSSGYSLLTYGEFDLATDRVQKNRGWVLSGNAFLPFLKRLNTGIRLNAGLLIQNSPSIFGLDNFKPTGWENAYLDDDAFVRYGLKIVQPVLFPDNGFITVPAFARGIYLYGFAEHLHRASDFSDNVSSAGGGIGLKFRLFHHFDFDLTYGAAFRFKDKKWVSHTNVVQE